MGRRVLIIDTSILNCWLQVPGKETCGPDEDRWDFDRTDACLQQAIRDGATLVLPVATLIETGNHIAHVAGDRYTLAEGLVDILNKTLNEEEPWAAFEHQSELWTTANLNRLAEEWPQLAARGLGIGDATIMDVADYYAKVGTLDVQILTGDRGLSQHQPISPTLPPRRRRSR